MQKSFKFPSIKVGFGSGGHIADTNNARLLVNARSRHRSPGICSAAGERRCRGHSLSVASPVYPFIAPHIWSCVAADPLPVAVKRRGVGIGWRGRFTIPSPLNQNWTETTQSRYRHRAVKAVAQITDRAAGALI